MAPSQTSERCYISEWICVNSAVGEKTEGLYGINSAECFDALPTASMEITVCTQITTHLKKQLSH
jgi:hypothetical protein